MALIRNGLPMAFPDRVGYAQQLQIGTGIDVKPLRAIDFVNPNLLKGGTSPKLNPTTKKATTKTDATKGRSKASTDIDNMLETIDSQKEALANAYQNKAYDLMTNNGTPEQMERLNEANDQMYAQLNDMRGRVMFASTREVVNKKKWDDDNDYVGSNKIGKLPAIFSSGEIVDGSSFLNEDSFRINPNGKNIQTYDEYLTNDDLTATLNSNDLTLQNYNPVNRNMSNDAKAHTDMMSLLHGVGTIEGLYNFSSGEDGQVKTTSGTNVGIKMMYDAMFDKDSGVNMSVKSNDQGLALLANTPKDKDDINKMTWGIWGALPQDTRNYYLAQVMRKGVFTDKTGKLTSAYNVMNDINNLKQKLYGGEYDYTDKEDERKIDQNKLQKLGDDVVKTAIIMSHLDAQHKSVGLLSRDYQLSVNGNGSGSDKEGKYVATPLDVMVSGATVTPDMSLYLDKQNVKLGQTYPMPKIKVNDKNEPIKDKDGNYVFSYKSNGILEMEQKTFSTGRTFSVGNNQNNILQNVLGGRDLTKEDLQKTNINITDLNKSPVIIDGIGTKVEQMWNADELKGMRIIGVGSNGIIAPMLDGTSSPDDYNGKVYSNTVKDANGDARHQAYVPIKIYSDKDVEINADTNGDGIPEKEKLSKLYQVKKQDGVDPTSLQVSKLDKKGLLTGNGYVFTIYVPLTNIHSEVLENNKGSKALRNEQEQMVEYNQVDVIGEDVVAQREAAEKKQEVNEWLKSKQGQESGYHEKNGDYAVKTSKGNFVVYKHNDTPEQFFDKALKNNFFLEPTRENYSLNLSKIYFSKFNDDSTKNKEIQMKLIESLKDAMFHKVSEGTNATKSYLQGYH